MPPAALTQSATNLLRHHHCLTTTRTFINARVKWVRDPYLDTAVEKEKNLSPLLSLKSLILSQPSRTLPVSAAAAHKDRLRLPAAAGKFIRKYPSVFKGFRPIKKLALPHVKITHQALIVHNEEARVCGMDCKDSNGIQMLGLELISWRDELAVSAMERRAMGVNSERRRGMRIAFPMDLPRGFDLDKRVKNWVDEWQKLPYISPYENAFHLAPDGDQAEKWTVAVLHELLHLMVSKKTERENLYRLGDYLGFGKRFKKALVHHPGIFYVSNKIRTQTVVLREAYRKDFLLEKHPLMEHLDSEEKTWDEVELTILAEKAEMEDFQLSIKKELYSMRRMYSKMAQWV
ncbi:hypothetical protein C3L33_21259, partial [Rhododendron williamsianum]